jgi:hypothetical protein
MIVYSLKSKTRQDSKRKEQTQHLEKIHLKRKNNFAQEYKSSKHLPLNVA